jgi:hypothetical protein
MAKKAILQESCLGDFFPPEKFFSLAPKISRNFIGMVPGKFLMAICDLKDIDNPD